MRRAYLSCMQFIKYYLKYLRDNPEGYWFKRKLYGWGWVPARWQGWIVLLGYILFIVIIAYRIEGNIDKQLVLGEVALPFLFATALLIFVCYAKGEKPRWQWGKHIDD